MVTNNGGKVGGGIRGGKRKLQDEEDITVVMEVVQVEIEVEVDKCKTIKK